MSLLRLTFLAALAALALPAQAQTECVDGFAGEYPCLNVALLASVSPQALGAPAPGACARPYTATCAMDIWGWTDPENGREYAVIALSGGTAFVDVSSPTAPRLLGSLATATSSSSWRDVKVIGHHAVIVSEARDHGMQVFDLRRLRGLSPNASRTFQADARYQGFGSAHNIVVNEQSMFAYAVGTRQPRSGLPASCGAPGLHAIDMSDPTQPAFAACVSDADRDPTPVISAGYTHDAQCVLYRGPDTDYQGRELCFASNEDVVTVFDVTDKAQAVIVAQVEYPGDAYTHQGWLSQDQRYFLVNDELDEIDRLVPTQRTLILDLEDLDEPGDVTIYDSGITSIDHNLYVRGRYVFESNYEAGLRILEFDPATTAGLTEVAYFDTHPERTAIEEPCLPPNASQQCDGFNGQWSNYPYFNSGIVIASDAQRGLFVLRPAAALAVDAQDAPEAGYVLTDLAPNPTTGDARMTLSVDQAQPVRADLFDIAGRRVATVFSGTVSPGSPVALTVRRTSLPSAVYLVRVTGATFEASRRLVIMR